MKRDYELAIAWVLGSIGAGLIIYCMFGDLRAAVVIPSFGLFVSCAILQFTELGGK